MFHISEVGHCTHSDSNLIVEGESQEFYTSIITHLLKGEKQTLFGVFFLSYKYANIAAKCG